jgi:hypothetical protein
MVYKVRTGTSWRDLPERYRPRKTACTPSHRYTLDGVFTRAPHAPGKRKTASERVTSWSALVSREPAMAPPLQTRPGSSRTRPTVPAVPLLPA